MNGLLNGDSKAHRTSYSYDLALPADDCGEPMALGDSFAPAPVKPWDPQRRMPGLIRSAVNLRSLAAQHWKEARLHVHAARLARANGDLDRLLECLDEARQARRKALKCDSFAKLCEGRAATLANLLRMSPCATALL